MRHLANALDAYRAALNVRIESEHPVDWAGTKINLGNALSDRGDRTGGAFGATLIFEAIDQYYAAFKVYTEAQHPVGWATTHLNLGLAHEALAENETCADARAKLQRSAECFEASLRVYDPEHMLYYHETASAALERVRGKLDRLD